jgi:hypothetical protein
MCALSSPLSRGESAGRSEEPERPPPRGSVCNLCGWVAGALPETPCCLCAGMRDHLAVAGSFLRTPVMTLSLLTYQTRLVVVTPDCRTCPRSTCFPSSGVCRHGADELASCRSTWSLVLFLQFNWRVTKNAGLMLSR